MLHFDTYSITLHLSNVYDEIIDIDIGQTLTLRLEENIDIVIDTGQWFREIISLHSG